MRYRIISLVFICFCVAAQQNLIRNGDCEKLDNDGYLSNFSRIPEWGGSGIKLSSFLPDSDSYQGNYAAKFQNAGAGGFIAQRDLKLKPGQTYRFSFMVKTELGPIMEASIRSNSAAGAMVCLFPTLPSNWTGVWPKIGLPRLSAGGGSQEWREMKSYFKADEKYHNIWMAIYVMGTTGTAWFDNFELAECSQEEAEAFTANNNMVAEIPDLENLVPNGSFEFARNSDMPDFIYTGIGAAWFNDTWETKLISDDYAPDGKRYFRIVGDKFNYTSPSIAIAPERELILSFYARALENEISVAVNFEGPAKYVKVFKEWRKFVFHYPPFSKAQNKRVSIGGLKSGEKLDIDAIMLHYGKEESPYSPSNGDMIFRQIAEARNQPFFNTRDKIIKATAVKEKIVLDGNLEKAAWNNVPFVKLPGMPVTDAAVCRQGENLYFAFRCHESEMDKLLVNPGDKDWTIGFDDCIKVSLITSPEADNQKRYVFTVNTIGKKLAEFSLGQTVQLPWEAVVVKHDNFWTVEMMIPAAVLTSGNAAPAEWGINFMRLRPSYKGKNRLNTFWSGKKLEDFGCLKMASEFMPVATLGKAQLFYTIDNKPEIRIPYESETVMRWEAVTPRGKKLNTAAEQNRLIIHGSSKLDIMAQNSFQIIGRNPEGDIIYFNTFRFDGKLPPLMELDFRYQLAFQGKGNLIKGIFRIAPELLENIDTELLILNAEGQTAELKKYSARELTQGITAGQSLPPGKYTVKASFQWNNRTHEVSAPWQFEVFPQADNYTRADRFSHMVEKNGKPYFPCALGFSLGWRFRQFIPDIKATGFDLVFLWSADLNDKYNQSKFMETYDELEKHGIDVIASTPLTLDMNKERKYGAFGIVTQSTFEEIIDVKKKFMQQYKKRKPIIMWSHYDEIYGYWEKKPVAKKESQLTESQQILKAFDPTRLAWNNSTISNRLYGGPQSTDIVSATIYTIRNMGGAAGTISAGEGLAGVGRKLNGKPSIAGIWLQFYSGHGEVGTGGREPGLDEMTCMMYGCIIKGIRAFWYFNQRPLSDILWKGTGKLIQEINELTPIMAYGRQMSVSSSHSGIITAGFKYEKKLYILSVNTSYSAVKAALTIPPDYSNKAVDKFTGREIPIRNFTIKDNFAPLERHVYVVDSQ